MSVLPRIVQFALQFLGAWSIAPGIKRWFPAALVDARPYDILLDAFLIGAVVMIIGHACALSLKDIRRPSGAKLLVTFVLAFALAALTLVPQFNIAVEQIVPALRTNRFVYPLVGALIGYWVTR